MGTLLLTFHIQNIMLRLLLHYSQTKNDHKKENAVHNKTVCLSFNSTKYRRYMQT